MTYPKVWFLNVLYALVLFNFHRGITLKPFRTFLTYKIAHAILLFLYLNNFMLLFYGCENIMEDFTYLFDPKDPNNIINTL